jgi:predicted regulator of Ras-like GTPase activity (Roadblock/LC7/MglB family)
MFQTVLTKLLTSNKDVLGVLFLDGTGETVDLVCGDFSPDDMRIVGAYLGIYLRRFEKLLSGNGLGELRIVHIEKRGIHIYMVPMPDEYCLALVQKRPALVAQARASLGEAVEQLRHELFG